MFNLSLCHWSIQLFDLCVPSSTDLPVLLLNQPNDDRTFLLVPGLKTDVENDILWSEIGSEFGEPDRPTKNVLPVSFFDYTPSDSRFCPLESGREY